MKTTLLPLTNLLCLLFIISSCERPNTPPVADFTISETSGTIKTIFVFDASNSADLEDKYPDLKFRWDWESDGIWDSEYLTTRTAMYQFKKSGTYAIKLEVKDLGGLTDAETHFVTVSPEGGAAPTASFKVNPSSGNTNTTFSFDASGCKDLETPVDQLLVRWDWENDGSWTNYTTDKSATHLYNIAGTYLVKLEVKDGDGLVGTSESEIKVSEAISPEGTFIDTRDGRSYKYITIGNQVWMAENLAFLPFVSPSRIGDGNNGSETDAQYFVQGYAGTDTSNAKATDNYKTFGVLYNWPAAVLSCPYGWHLPSQEEFATLIDYLGDGHQASLSLKSRTGWFTDQQITGNGNNNSGFSGVPGGYWYQSNFSGTGMHGVWATTTRSTTENIIISFNLRYDIVHWWQGAYLKTALSLRCIKGEGGDFLAVFTYNPYDINSTSARIDCKIQAPKAMDVTQKGVCWKMVDLPTINDSKTNEGPGLLPFTSSITGLEANSTYFARAYAISNGKVWYGNYIIFQTQE